MSGQLRILEIVTTRFAGNGITAYVLSAMEALGGAAHCDVVAINAPEAALAARASACGGRVFVLPMRNRNPIAYVRALSGIIREGQYDVVHAHGNSCTLLAEMLAAKRGGAAARIPHAHNTACRQKLLHRLLRPFFDRSYTGAAACGQAAGRFLFGEKPFTVLNNGVDTASFAFDAQARKRLREELGLSNCRALLHAGSFNEQKNQAFLLEPFLAAYREDASLRLLLAGDGPLMEAVRQRAAALGLSGAVQFLGRRADMPALLSAADGFLLPSLHEGFPIALVEAQCAGLPCFVADTVTTDAAIGENVRFLPLKPEDWTRALCETAPASDAARAGAAETVRRAGFERTDAAVHLLDFYRRVAERGRPGGPGLRKLFLMTHNMAGGGCERVIAQLANRFAAAGVDCAVLTEYRHESFFPLEEGVRLVPLSEGAACRSRDIPRVYGALRRLVRRERPDVVLAMPEKVNVWTVLFLLGSGVPVVVSERNDPERHPESRLKRLLRRLVYPFARGFIFQTEQQAAYFSPRIRRRGIVLDNPLDLSRVPEPCGGAREKTVVTAARLSPQKNLPLLLAAFRAFYKAHPDWTLVIHGEGEERAALERLAAELPAGAVSLPGASGDVLERMKNGGMFVLSSDFEGMPNALIEAMAMGLCCIATDCPAGGPAALISDGENGLLTPVGDSAALAQAMLRAAEEPGLAARLGEAALGIRTRLDADVVAEKWRTYLERSIPA